VTREQPHAYDLYGLTVRSTIPLIGARSAAPESSVDVAVSRGETVPSTLQTPSGEVLLDFATGQRWYSLAREAADRYLFRIYGVCDLEVSDNLHEVTLRPAADMTQGMEPIMIRGSLAALQLYLRGHLVLHASAVQLVDYAVAFIGHSGMGKSTLATLMCADGNGTVITDDVLRVDEDSEGRPTTRLGSTEVRLRAGANGLSDRFATADLGRSMSADQRLLLRPQRPARDRLPLRMLVIPHPTRESDTVELVRLPAKDAFISVLSFPRLMGWRDPQILGQIFTQVGWLVSMVPVVVAKVPWGPPFAKDLTAKLNEALRSVVH
jgi:hypothetical protein